MNRSGFFATGLLLLAHCGSGAADGAPPSSNDEPASPAPTSGHGPPVGDAGHDPGQSDGGSAAQDACAPEDVPDDQGADTNCDGVDGVIGRDVYVSADASGADTNLGTPSSPLHTIAAALALATTRNGHVLVAAGTYAVESLANAGAWWVVGGYGGGFNAPPKREETILSASDTGLLLDQAQSASLAHLTVRGGQPGDPAQPTAHALRSNVGALVLDDVVIQSADGLSLRPAASGDPGKAGRVGGPLACDGAQQPAYASGATTGPSGEGKPAGNVSAHAPPSAGSAGLNASDGVDATGTPSVSNGLLVGDVGQSGGSDGGPGYGAPAGGNGQYGTGQGAYTFWGGTGGSGGCPGKGGSGGASGGSSVAVVVLKGALTVTRSRIGVGLGGNGADGGGGGAGGTGSWGGSPMYTNDTPVFTPGAGVSVPPCTKPSEDPMGFACAAFGGRGGDGGAGGHGGGGAGGWAIGIVTIGAATSGVDSATVFDLGSPGNGGMGNGGGHAPGGKRAQTLHLD